MKLLSIDIGIKNLAFIIIETNETNETNEANEANDFKIIKWDVINLCSNNNNCVHHLCKNKPAFFKNSTYYCKIHAKKTAYSIPLCNIKTLHKLSLKKLIAVANEYKLVFDKSIKKPMLIVLLETHLNEHCLEAVQSVSANTINLVHIGINIKDRLNELFKDYNILTLDKIILENQISPIANRMKTIQGMIAQYFINSNNYNIYFISATNKLKSFLKDKSDLISRTSDSISSTSDSSANKITYAQRKKLSIFHTKEVLKKYNMNNEVSFFSEHSKKDDLADCFLQAYYYINIK
jgi:hypothetical protein